ncbi:hypothetical protein K0B04_01695 [Patescibacteria group bacterium]|nr:hypothetical protein [Patescibacteria group bacterium]
MKIKIINWIKNNALISSILMVSLFTLFGYLTYNSINIGNGKNDSVKNNTIAENKEEPRYSDYSPSEKITSMAAGEDSCNINLSEQCAQIIFNNSTVKFSETFENIMNSAGRKFQTPPAVLIAYMAGINSIHKFSYLFEEENEDELKKSFHWGGQIRGCDDLDPMEQGPYDWIWNWFTATMDATNAGDVLNELSSGRRNAASRCNFIDATYVAAAHFSQANGKGCGAEWSDLIGALKSLSWGSVLEESYAEDRRYEDGSIEAYFKACSY